MVAAMEGSEILSQWFHTHICVARRRRLGRQGPRAVNLTTSMVAERIPLLPLRGPIEMVVDPLGARILLRTTKPQPRWPHQWRARAEPSAPRCTNHQHGIELRCRTRRFRSDPHHRRAPGSSRHPGLRGCPGVRVPVVPSYHYEPVRSGIGTPAGRKPGLASRECAAAGRGGAEAATQFPRRDGATRHQPGRRCALGDLALAPATRPRRAVVPPRGVAGPSGAWRALACARSRAAAWPRARS